jgi:hypothetical protein
MNALRRKGWRTCASSISASHMSGPIGGRN